MIRENNIPEGAATVTLDCGLEAYMRGRNDPIHFLATFQFNREHLRDDALVESFVSIVTSTVKTALFDRTSPVMTMSDGKGNTVMLETADVQAISLLAPEPNTITEAIAASDEEKEDG